MMLDLAESAAPLLLHPSESLRGGVLQVVTSIAQQLGLADTHVRLVPLMAPYFRGTASFGWFLLHPDFASGGVGDAAGMSHVQGSMVAAEAAGLAALRQTLRAPIPRHCYNAALKACGASLYQQQFLHPCGPCSSHVLVL